MNEDQIKEYLGKYVLPQDNKANENILREILFSSQIDWEQAVKSINKHHPETLIK